MKRGAFLLLLCGSAACSYAQAIAQNVPSNELQAILSQPLDQELKLRETHKEPLKAAYARQMALVGKDCLSDSDQGQQPYNVCMGRSSERADKDFDLFYNHLQMLCHSQEQLKTMQSFEATWLTYKASAMNATHASWPDGTGASGFASQVYLTLVRDHMRHLHAIYGLNVDQ